MLNIIRNRGTGSFLRCLIFMHREFGLFSIKARGKFHPYAGHFDETFCCRGLKPIFFSFIPNVALENC